ncbi:unnamed protein product [Cylicocyclus nassatus]|uniref:Uncharacterized protein n=1 Tax=Cylicocyclus nassatus TaxID=53992 RepID=A0AA36HGT8_CYLNA|nr:unnamed protein product [Cylicocyclus nassatus]
MWRVSTALFTLLAVLANAADLQEQAYELPDGEYANELSLLELIPQPKELSGKPDLDSETARYDKREEDLKKELLGVFRYGKRSNKKSVPGVLRFGKRSVPGVLRFGKREIPGVLRFGKRSMPSVLRFGKRREIPGMMRFGKRACATLWQVKKHIPQNGSNHKRVTHYSSLGTPNCDIRIKVEQLNKVYHK